MSLKTHSFKFGDYFLDGLEKVLFRSGKPVSITPKAFLLLQTLVEKQGHLVEKEQLMQAVWADSFVEQGNLSFTINLLRKALGDDSHDPRFIETVPRRGYRFIAEAIEKTSETDVRAEIAVSERYSIPRLAIYSSVFIFLVAVSWYAVGSLVRSDITAPLLNASFKSEAISRSGDVLHAVISPDGNLAAYSSETGKKQSLWLRNLTSSVNIQLIPPSDDHYLGLAFSKDGLSVYFVRKGSEDNSLTAIYHIGAFGGIPSKIIDKAEGWISISPDDRQISFVRCHYSDDDYCSLFTADVDGSNERKIVSKPRPDRISANQFSPDGRSIAFATGQSNNGQAAFQLLQSDLTTGIQSSITSREFFNIKSLVWLPSGNDLLFTAMETLDGKAKIWQISPSVRFAVPLTNDVVSYAEISLDRSASRMIATNVANSFRLSRTIGERSTALVSARSMIFSPDGSIVYQADDNNIWSISSEGGSQRQLTSDTAGDSFPIVSPDARYVFFSSNRSGSNQVWRMNADGTNQIQLTQNEGGKPCFVSQDGKWVYYLSALGSNLWKVSSDGGGQTLVNDRKMYEPTLAANGESVAYFYHDKQWQIGISDLVSNRPMKTIDYANGKSPPIKISWSADSRFISYVAKTNGRNSLWQQATDDSKPLFVADLGDEEIADFSLSPDGNGFATISGKWMHDAVLINGLK